MGTPNLLHTKLHRVIYLTRVIDTNNYYKIPTGEQKKTMELVHNTVIIVRIILLPISWVR